MIRKTSKNSAICRIIIIGIILGNIIFLFNHLTTSTQPSITINTSSLTITPNHQNSFKSLNIKIPDHHSPHHPQYKSSSITLLNRKLRRPLSKNCTLPPGFPGGPPGYKRLIRVCQHLPKFSIHCPSGMRCIDCIPPWGGDKPPVIDMTKQFKKYEELSRNKRRNELINIINNGLKLEHDESSILIMALNYGYAYLFVNWLCGLHLRGIADNIRETTIIIATDNKAYKLAKELGFQAVETTWLDVKIDEKAAKQFALGPHRWAVSLQIVYTYDLLTLGYNVIMQDVDIIWLKDVRKYFENTFLDIEMLCDGRLDSIGPGNSGFIHIRSNCKTKIYLETILYYIGLVISGRSDQRVWNLFLTSYDFRQLTFEMLPPDKFIGGHQWGNGRKRGDELSNDIWFMHASWTFSHNEKIVKFEMLDYWFYNKSCPFYNKIEVPEHIEPPYYQLHEDRNWTWPDPKAKKWW